MQDYNKKRREERKRGKTKRKSKLNEQKEKTENDIDRSAKPSFKEKCPICLDEYSVEVTLCLGNSLFR